MAVTIQIPDSHRTAHHILVGIDQHDSAQLAFTAAIIRAQINQAALTIVSVIEPDDVPFYDQLDEQRLSNVRQKHQEQLDGYVLVAKKFGLTHVHSVLGEGVAGAVIVNEIIPQVRPDLLVIGAETKRGTNRHFGSQAAYMTKFAPISVVLVR